MAEDEIPQADRVPGFPHPRETRTVFGQDAAADSFLSALAWGRLHHAWLLRGPAGIGKATLAYRIARALIAMEAEDGLFGAPGYPASLATPPDCPVQARIEAGAEPRLFVLNRRWNPDTKRLPTRILVDHVREMRGFLSLSAADGGWRAVIIDAIDEMNPNAANALLKFLEEPPARTVFLIVCHAPAGLLPTIRSRCRTLDLSPLSPEALSAALAGTGAEVSAEEAGPLAQLTSGSVGRSLALVASDGLQEYARLTALFGRGERIDRARLAALSEAVAGRQGADRYALVLSLLQVLIARLARAAATGHVPPPAVPGEDTLIRTVAFHPRQGPLWAETLTRIAASTRHAQAVNLDPGQCVIDTFLELDATLGRVRQVAA